jgi:hypothetical protein
MKNFFKNHFELGKYDDQFQVGVSFGFHKTWSEYNFHFHFWIDLGFWYIQITIGDNES